MLREGAEGLAEVLSLEPAPDIEPLPEGCNPTEYRLVTGTFKHTSGEVYDLKLKSESKPIGVTATHPFWSCDRNGWVSAIDLEVGETLKTLAGTTVVESRSKREEPETVYNIEVEGDHVYRVGESGVLVHNASPGCVNNKKGFIDYGDFDDWGVETTTSNHYGGRPKGVHAFLVIGQKQGSDAKDYLIPPGWNDLPKSNRARGHLLARQLGGSGSEALNIVALYQNKANDPAMKTCENRIAEALRCECVEVWITPQYVSTDGAPSAIKIVAVGDRGFKLNSTIANSATATTPSQCVKK